MKKKLHFRWMMCFLLALVLLAASFGSALAAADPLKPDDLLYDDGNIVLHKQAKRVSEDEWEITVRADIINTPVEKPQIELVFVLDTSNSMLGCSDMNLHSMPLIHNHDDDCPLGDDCDALYVYHRGNNYCYYLNTSYQQVKFEPNRYQVAIGAINSLTDSLPADTNIKRVIFSIPAYTEVVSEFDPNLKTFGGSTYLMDGVNLGVEQFSDDDKTKIMIIVTDGAATHSSYSSDLYSTSEFEAFRNAGGIVFTVGFNHDDPNLKGMTANGGSYFTAANPGELTKAFEAIEGKITAMLVDPMGSAVGFEPTSVTPAEDVVTGEFTFTQDVIYWTPDVSSTSLVKGTIQYSYQVKLNDSADTSVGAHQAPLNDPTSLLYGITNSQDEVEMKDAAFPIPVATYAISSVQVNWKCGDTDVLPPTETESIINDFGTPAFETNYQTITQLIPATGNNKYRYTGTTITRNGAVVDAVDPADPATFVVTHNYELAEAYNVTYEYTGTVPEGAPEASLHNTTGKPGDTVTVADAPTLQGWVFSGWTVAEGGVTAEGGSFTMPRNDVKLTGSWTQVKNSYQVQVNYFTSTDGAAYVQDNAAPVELAALTETAETTVTVDYTAALTYGGNTYGSPALAEGSAGQLDGSNAITVTPADPTALVTLNLYREVKNPYQAVVHYQDDAGNTLQADLVSDEILFGDEYDVSTAEAVGSITVNGVIYDFAGDDTAANGTAYTGTMPVDGVEIIRTYTERAKATATVHYMDEAGNTLQLDLVSEATYIGNGYNVSEAEEVTTITVDGVIYDFTGDDTAANGTAYTGEMPEDGLEIIRTYAERAKATATVHYVDTEGNTLQLDLVSEATYIGNGYDVSEAEGVTTITVDGVIYDFSHDDTAANGTTYTGDMPEGGVEIIRTYAERGKATAIVHYVDESGNSLQPDTVSDAIYIGSPYDVAAAETVVTITTETGIIYDFSHDDTAANGTTYTGDMPEDGVEIIRTYAERGKATATVHYVDTEGYTLQLDLVSEATYIGNGYDVSEAEGVTTITVDGVIYDFSHDDTAANGTAYTGDMPEGGVEIIRTYAERAKATAIVHYVDESGNSLQPDTVSETIYIGSPYDVTAAEAVVTITTETGIIYDYSHDDTAANGTAYTGDMPEDGVEITRTYAERGKAIAIVHYVDEAGNALQPDTVSDAIYIGSPYDVTAAEAVVTITTETGIIYDFSHDDTSANGTTYTGDMPEDGVEIIRTYAERGKATVIVHYVDESGNSLQPDTVSDAIYIGSSYDVTAAEAVVTITTETGIIYDFSHDDTAANGTAYTGEMPEGGVEITRTYIEHGKATAIVHYVDESGNSLQPDTVSDATYIGSPYDVTAALAVESIEKDGKEYRFVADYLTESAGEIATVADDAEASDEDYAGTMPEGGVEITRVYREVAYYYQLRHEYTAYDAGGAVVYTAADTWPVMSTFNRIHTIQSPDTYDHAGQTYLRVSEGEQTGDLSGTAQDAPYVFVVYYELREDAPEGTPTPTPTPTPAPVPTPGATLPPAPPQTGDEGPALWLMTLILSGAGLMLLMAASRRRQRG